MTEPQFVNRIPRAVKKDPIIEKNARISQGSIELVKNPTHSATKPEKRKLPATDSPKVKTKRVRDNHHISNSKISGQKSVKKKVSVQTSIPNDTQVITSTVNKTPKNKSVPSKQISKVKSQKKNNFVKENGTSKVESTNKQDKVTLKAKFNKSVSY